MVSTSAVYTYNLHSILIGFLCVQWIFKNGCFRFDFEFPAVLEMGLLRSRYIDYRDTEGISITIRKMQHEYISTLLIL